MTRARTLRLVVPVVAAGLLAAACSSGGGSSPTTTTAAAASSASSAAAPSSAASGATLSVADGHLVDSTGRTVYLWVADTGTASTCSGSCATAWPPVPSSGAPTAGTGVTAAQITTISRSDGSQQLAYHGHPLYYFIQDKAAGDALGQGSSAFGAKWWEVDGSGGAITTVSAPSTAPNSAAKSSSSDNGGYGY